MKAPYIILISGKIKSGKDSVAEIATEYLEEKGLKVANLKFAGGIKRAVTSMYNIPSNFAEEREFKSSFVHLLGDKTFRELFIDVGQAIRESISEDFWTTILIHEIQAAKADIVLISDWRFDNEAQAILQYTSDLAKLTGRLANNMCCFFRVEAGPKREDIVRKELIMQNFLEACKKIGHVPEFDKNGVPKTVKGEIKMLDSMFKVAAIQQDISEVSLDDFINKADYFDLVIQNEQNAFDATKSTVITYLNKVQW